MSTPQLNRSLVPYQLKGWECNPTASEAGNRDFPLYWNWITRCNHQHDLCPSISIKTSWNCCLIGTWGLRKPKSVLRPWSLVDSPRINHLLCSFEMRAVSFMNTVQQVGSEDQTLVIMLGGKHIYSLSYHTSTSYSKIFIVII